MRLKLFALCLAISVPTAVFAQPAATHPYSTTKHSAHTVSRGAFNIKGYRAAGTWKPAKATHGGQVFNESASNQVFAGYDWKPIASK